MSTHGSILVAIAWEMFDFCQSASIAQHKEPSPKILHKTLQFAVVVFRLPVFLATLVQHLLSIVPDVPSVDQGTIVA